jgi:FkbM family methyltransferase
LRIIKILSCHIDPARPIWLHRQTPAGDGVFGNSRFVFNAALQEYDYLAVVDDLPPGHVECVDREKAVLVFGEPPCVKQHSSKYLDQFGTVLTQDQNTRHPGARFTHTGLPWHLWLYSKPEARYADFVGLQPTKTKLMSVICSNKAFTPEHRQRLKFVEKLRQRFGDRIDFFGRGFHEITDKAEALLPYRYHITLENCSIPDYWTEKLADAYLAGCLPLYWGCTNIDKYFPEDSLIRLDIEDCEAACATIERVLISDEDAQRRGALEDARQRVLGEHNVFGVLDKIFGQLEKKNNHNPKTESVIMHPEQMLKDIGLAQSQQHSMLRLLRRCLRHPLRIGTYIKEFFSPKQPVYPWLPAYEQLRFQYPLSADSVVYDLGGYKGDWAAVIAERFDCTIEIFEPFVNYANTIEQRFTHNTKIHVHAFGLSDKDERPSFSVMGDASSIFASDPKGDATTEVQLYDIHQKLENVPHIDLIKINIEGGEYPVLDRLIEMGDIKKINYLQVQFHTFFPDAEAHYQKIAKNLAQTHRLVWRVPFVWESWQRL